MCSTHPLPARMHTSSIQRQLARNDAVLPYYPPTSRPAARLHRTSSRPQFCTHATQRDFYSSNLGVLQPVVEQSVSPAEDPYAMQRVSPDSFSSRGYYLDGSAIFGSVVLLVLLLAITFERILGLDRLINQAIQNWKESRQYKRRNEVIQARQALEESWDGEEDAK